MTRQLYGVLVWGALSLAAVVIGRLRRRHVADDVANTIRRVTGPAGDS